MTRKVNRTRHIWVIESLTQDLKIQIPVRFRIYNSAFEHSASNVHVCDFTNLTPLAHDKFLVLTGVRSPTVSGGGDVPHKEPQKSPIKIVVKKMELDMDFG